MIQVDARRNVVIQAGPGSPKAKLSMLCLRDQSSTLILCSIEEESEGEEEMDEDMDMEMDLESEEDDSVKPPVASSSKTKSAKPKTAGKNPYPLEGKYIDEDDRDQ